MYFSIFFDEIYDIKKNVVILSFNKYYWDDLFKVIVVLVGEYFCKINLFCW
jgi:hypothetical protein